MLDQNHQLLQETSTHMNMANARKFGKDCGSGDPSKPGPSESGPSELLVTPVICVKTTERIITEPSADLHLHLELSVLRAACCLLYAAAVFC